MTNENIESIVLCYKKNFSHSDTQNPVAQTIIEKAANKTSKNREESQIFLDTHIKTFAENLLYILS